MHPAKPCCSRVSWIAQRQSARRLGHETPAGLVIAKAGPASKDVAMQHRPAHRSQSDTRSSRRIGLPLLREGSERGVCSPQIETPTGWLAMRRPYQGGITSRKGHPVTGAGWFRWYGLGVIKLILYLALIGAFCFFGSTVKLGKHTLFGHVRAIWHTEEVQDLKNGVEDKAAPAVDKLKKGGEAAYKAMKDGDGSNGSAGSGVGSAVPHTP